MKADRVWGVVLTVGSGVLLWVAFQPQRGSLVTDFSIMFWPRLLLVGLFSLSLLLLIAGSLRSGDDRGAVESDSSGLVWRHWLFALIGVGYLILIYFIGFLWAALAFSVVSIKTLGAPRWRAVLTFSVVLVALIWIVIIIGLKVPLPRGIGIFREINIHLY